MVMDAMKQAEALLASVKFPPQPKIVLAIHEELKKSVPDFKSIAALLSRDLALSARLVKLVNSPLYQLNNKVTSIPHALSFLGLETFNKFVLTAALQEVLKDRFATDPRILEHGLAVAVVAGRVAGRVQGLDEVGVNPDTAYLAGLFHDCGLSLMSAKFKDYGRFIETELGQEADVTAREEQLFATSHTQVGRLVVRSWGLPALVGDAVFNHHDVAFPERMKDLGAIKLTAILHLADWQANKFAFTSGRISHFNQQQWTVADWDQANENVLFELGLDHDEVKDLEEEVITDLYEVLK